MATIPQPYGILLVRAAPTHLPMYSANLGCWPVANPRGRITDWQVYRFQREGSDQDGEDLILLVKLPLRHPGDLAFPMLFRVPKLGTLLPVGCDSESCTVAEVRQHMEQLYLYTTTTIADAHAGKSSVPEN